MTAPLLTARNLSRRFIPGQPSVVDDLSLDLHKGEILALVGPSGCGKSTTLRMIAGLETADTGSVRLDGQTITDLAPEKRGIGMVFQDYALFPYLDVADNVLFGAPEKSADTAARYLNMVGLKGLGQRFPDEISGGQQQRVALARSLAAEPRLLLLDEPFSNLDAALRSATRQEIRRLLKATGMAVLCVTHDQEEALSFADRIAVMRDGRILQTGTPFEIYDTPADPFVAGFMGRTNFLDGIAHGTVCETPLGRALLMAPTTGPVKLLVRPEHFSLRRAQEPGQGNGRIVEMEFKGHSVTYRVDCAGLSLQVDAGHGSRLKLGDEVELRIAEQQMSSYWARNGGDIAVAYSAPRATVPPSL